MKRSELRSYLLNGTRIGLAASVVAVGISCKTGEKSVEIKRVEQPHQVTKDMFSEKEANDVAKQSGLSAESFFKFDKVPFSKINAFQEKDLYPIYPPSVLEYKKVIYNLSDEFHIPPNVIATVMTIESGGDPKAGSFAGAIGLFQPLADKFPASIHAIPNPDARLAAMQDPLTNGRAGMRYFQACLEVARSENANLSPTDARVYAKAMIFYNAGYGRAHIRFDHLPDESKFYGDHFIRFALTAEIAKGLRDKGKDDKSIVRALSSREVDARSYALRQFHDKNGGVYPYSYLTEALKLLGNTDFGTPRAPVNTSLGFQLDIDYKAYLANPTYTTPANPGLRIWLNLGGIGLFGRHQKNFDSKEWENISTKR